MDSERRALDKIYKRRDRYEIPDWQREEVWDDSRKRKLIDSILRKWKLPKFYFVSSGEDTFDVVDGQQRLAAIYEFFSNKLSLDEKSAKEFGGKRYRDLPQSTSDDFDDFEIEFDIISDATDADLKEFFQRVQAGLPLTSSERLNAVDSKLRDYCKNLGRHQFFKEIGVPNTRYAHFDIACKATVLEIEGLDAGLRFDEIKSVFEEQKTFAPSSRVGKRLKGALDLLATSFKGRGKVLRTRTIVQSLITLACRLVDAGAATDAETANEVREFFESFQKELGKEVELGNLATDRDYLAFQASINANVKGGAKTRHQILLRKLFRISPSLASRFDATIVGQSGVAGEIVARGITIADLIEQVNKSYAAQTGEDLFKPTNKTAAAIGRFRTPIKDLATYGKFIDDMYHVFREGAKARLEGSWPISFADVNDLRTDLRHDVDHGDAGKVRGKRKKLASAFQKYAGSTSSDTLEPSLFPMVQLNVLTAIEGDLRTLLASPPPKPAKTN
jgi:hypothetical protein